MTAGDAAGTAPASLTGFLAARLDEDEQMAKFATPGPWHIPEHDPLFYCVDSPDGSGRICKFGDRRCGDDVHNSLHIARHDPGRVLREAAAGRAILAAYEAVLRDGASAGDPARRPRLYGEHDGLRMAVTQLAAVYSDHPDYQEEWKP